MRAASLIYRRREPEGNVLQNLVRDHFETLRTRSAAGREGPGVPAFVEREFREFLTCGRLAGGFARFRCRACGTDRLVAFSCKGRGFCPSCGGRRMTERAAHLVPRGGGRWCRTAPERGPSPSADVPTRRGQHSCNEASASAKAAADSP